MSKVDPLIQPLLDQLDGFDARLKKLGEVKPLLGISPLTQYKYFGEMPVTSNNTDRYLNAQYFVGADLYDGRNLNSAIAEAIVTYNLSPKDEEKLWDHFLTSEKRRKDNE